MKGSIWYSLTLTGFEVEKKSISLPTVNGILIDMDDDTSKRPVAMRRGFLSGLAREIIFRKDDRFEGELEDPELLEENSEKGESLL